MCVRQYYSFLTRKYNVYDGERITTLFPYRGNNTRRNRITCDAVGTKSWRGRRYVVLYAEHTVYSKRAEQSNVWFSESGWCEIVSHQLRCVALLNTYIYIWILRRERGIEKECNIKGPLEYYIEPSCLHTSDSFYDDSATTPPASELANNTIYKFTVPVYRYNLT